MIMVPLKLVPLLLESPVNGIPTLQINHLVHLSLFIRQVLPLRRGKDLEPHTRRLPDCESRHLAILGLITRIIEDRLEDDLASVSHSVAQLLGQRRGTGFGRWDRGDMDSTDEIRVVASESDVDEVSDRVDVGCAGRVDGFDADFGLVGGCHFDCEVRLSQRAVG